MILYRYVLKEHIGPFFLGLVCLTFILIMNSIFTLIWDVVGKGLTLNIVLNLLLLSLPWVIALAVPMAVLVATLMAFGRISQDWEIGASKACGINPMSLVILPIIVSAILTIFMIWFNNHTLPQANHKLKNLMIDIGQKKPIFRMKALVTFSDFEGYDVQVKEVDYKNSLVKEVKVFEKTPPRREIFAKRGSFSIKGDILTMVLKDGEIHEMVNEQPLRYRRLSFSEHIINFPLDMTFTRKNRSYKGERELSAKELKNRIRDVKQGKGSEKYKRMKINRLLVEYHKKYSIPFACIAFVIMGAPLAMRIRKGGASLSFGLALIFFIFYYVCLLGGEQLGDRGIIEPWLAMWFPNMLLGALGIYFLFRVNK
ncbi:MAG TPA: YjgP/YjgQ family permease [bacterium (Candidatus Stahlbacteria)]|nr:YjgP/YjgQ family permease [Candidatus Stahlbacteria bacterium]